MIFEYAIEPELIFQAVKNRGLCRYLASHFGHGNCCRGASFPRDVWQAANRAYEERLATATPKELGRAEIERIKITELWKKLMEGKTKRLYTEEAIPWGEHIKKSHALLPFSGGMCRQAHRLPNFILMEDLTKIERDSICSYKRSFAVKKTPKAIMGAIGPFLQSSSELTIVDPYFFVEEKYILLLEMILQELAKSGKVRTPLPIEVRIFCARQPNAKKSLPFAEFQQACDEQIKSLVPNGVKLTIVRLDNISGAEVMHGRYLISDIGGIVFGYGIDALPTSKCHDDLALMSEEQYALRKRMYSLATKDFSITEAPIIYDKHQVV